MKKRIILFVMVMFAVMSAFTLMSFASDVEVDADTLYDIEFYVEEAMADFGDTQIDVGIDIKRNPGLAGVIYELSYNDELFTLSTQPVLGTLTDLKKDSFGDISASPHLGMLSTPTGKSIIGNGRMVTYTFDIGPDAMAGTYPIEIRVSGESANGTELKVLDGNLKSIDTVVHNGSITIPGYTIKFDTNKGEGSFDEIIKTHGVDAVLPAGVPTRDGYDFLGWSVDKNATEAEFEKEGAFDVDADTVLYAIWKKQPLSADTVELTLTAGEVQNVEVSAGVFEKQVVVTVSTTQNPGFNGLVLYLDYDKTKLEYVKGTQIATGLFQAPQNDEFPFQLANADNFEENTALFSITFNVLDNAELGDAYVNLVPDKEQCTYHDGTGNVKRNVWVNEAYVTIGEPQLLGDINLDGTVDINDAILLFQHSMMSTVYPIDYVGNVDFTKDGTIDINDAILLFQYSMMPNVYPIS